MALELTPQMMLVLGILAFTIYMFVSEIVRVDVAAIIIMILLGLTNLFQPVIADGVTTNWLANLSPGLADSMPWLNQMLVPVVDARMLFNGFGSNAVISIIAVMIIGAGLDKTGLMSKVASFILHVGGSSEKRVIPIISGTVGIISSFMQNVGAAALFLPVVSRISVRTGLPLSRLLMPMGFCAILGGTVTMVGSSPLILLNDLIQNSNHSLPADQQMSTIGLFEVTPIGIALILTGIAYFILAGRYVLPMIKKKGAEGTNTMGYFRDTYGLSYNLREMVVTPESPVIGQTFDEMETHCRDCRVRVVAHRTGDDLRIGPGTLSRDVTIKAGDVMGILGKKGKLKDFAAEAKMEAKDNFEVFSESLIPTKSGIAELVIPPGSNLIGKSARDLWMRKVYGISLFAIHRQGHSIDEGVRQVPLQAGDTLAVHTAWDNLARLEKDRDFVVVTADYPHEEARPQKVPHALFFFFIALALVLFTDLRLSVALLTGSVGMIVSRVLTIDEAYKSIDWKTVFLLASLIPLGMAVEHTGTAAWIAQEILSVMDGVPIWGLQATIMVLATVFTLVMSNVGATVLLVPLAVNIALGAGADPRIFALTVAIGTSNSFLIPTHQVNALIMGPAGYKVKDFMKAGGVMTILFLIVSLTMMNIVF